MDIRSAFPSKYLKAGDLNGREAIVYVKDVQMEMIGEGSSTDQRPVVYFEGKNKGLALNKTNGNTIAEIYGWNTDAWRGKPIVIFESRTTFKGRPVDCLRVRIPTGSELRTQAGEEPPEEEPPPPEDPPESPEPAGDGIPF